MSLLHGDCLELLPTVADGSVDMVFADLPYGVTANKWDSVIPFEPLWAELLRVGKRNAAFVFTATFDFAVALRNSQPTLKCYDMPWQKNLASNFMQAKRRPLLTHESILVFYREQTTYSPQMEPRKYQRKGVKPARAGLTSVGVSLVHKARSYDFKSEVYPGSVRTFSLPARCKSMHPTQKPVALLEWLIRTYTNPGDTVLDPTMGSGTTGVACINTGRSFIGMEKDATYYATAQRRIADAQPPLIAVS